MKQLARFALDSPGEDMKSQSRRGTLLPMSVIYFTRELPGLSNDLELAGLQVYEALSLSEVFFLAEQHPTAHIVVDHTVEDDAAHEIAQHRPTLRLKPEAKVSEILWEVSGLSGIDTVQ